MARLDGNLPILAHPGLFGEPLMYGSAMRTEGAAEKDGHGVEARSICVHAGRNRVACSRAFDH
jgi:hypothetical protein